MSGRLNSTRAQTWPLFIQPRERNINERWKRNSYKRNRCSSGATRWLALDEWPSWAGGLDWRVTSDIKTSSRRRQYPSADVAQVFSRKPFFCVPMHTSIDECLEIRCDLFYPVIDYRPFFAQSLTSFQKSWSLRFRDYVPTFKSFSFFDTESKNFLFFFQPNFFF